VAQSALSLSRLGFAAFRVSWRLVDDGAAAPPSPATKAWWWRFVDAAGAVVTELRREAARCSRWRMRCGEGDGGDARVKWRGGEKMVCAAESWWSRTKMVAAVVSGASPAR